MCPPLGCPPSPPGQPGPRLRGAKFWAWVLEALGFASISDCVTLSVSLALSEPQFASYERGVLEKLMLPGPAREGEEKGKPNSVRSEGVGYPSGPGSALLSRR